MIKAWLNLDNIDTSCWIGERSIKDWWVNMPEKNTTNRKAMSSLIVLTCWTIWPERNARIFCHKSMLHTHHSVQYKKLG